MEDKITVEIKTHWSGIRFELRNKYGTICSSLDVEMEDGLDKHEYIPEFQDKKVLYLTNFETKTRQRNKGYAKYLLNYVIDHYKNNNECNYDMLHLNACPYCFKGNGEVKYEPPIKGLDIDKLLEFYKSFGLEIHGEYNITPQQRAFIMIMNL